MPCCTFWPSGLFIFNKELELQVLSWKEESKWLFFRVTLLCLCASGPQIQSFRFLHSWPERRKKSGWHSWPWMNLPQGPLYLYKNRAWLMGSEERRHTLKRDPVLGASIHTQLCTLPVTGWSHQHSSRKCHSISLTIFFNQFSIKQIKTAMVRISVAIICRGAARSFDVKQLIHVLLIRRLCYRGWHLDWGLSGWEFNSRHAPFQFCNHLHHLTILNYDFLLCTLEK